jgi:hypothetical protein
VEIEEQLMRDFSIWRQNRNRPEVTAPELVPFSVIAHLTFKILVRQVRFSVVYATWGTELWRAKNATSIQIRTAIATEFPLFTAIVTENNNPHLFLSAFHFLGALHNFGMLDFASLLEFATFSEVCPHPELPMIFQALAETTRIDPKEAISISSSDPRVVTSIVGLVEPGVPEPTDDDRAVAVGLYIRDLIFKTFLGFREEDDVAAQVKALLPKFALHLARARPIVISVFEMEIVKCQISEKQMQGVLAILTQL